MPLRGEQRALLQLLCERGQSYEDIAGLLGQDAATVRANARAALTEIGGADPDAEVGLTDFLLGQADPIGRADATRYLQSNPESLELAKRIEAGLLLVAPEAKLPKLPESRGKRARAAMPAADEVTRVDRPAFAVPITGSSSSSRQGRLIAAIAGVGVILIVGILVLTGVLFGGDDDDSSSSSGDTTEASADDPNADLAANTTNKETVELKPVGDSGVGGSVTFGLVNANDQPQPYADLKINGVPQPTKSNVSLLWLMVSDKGGIPFTPLVPDENGLVSGAVAIPAETAAAFSGQIKEIKVSNSNVDEVTEAVSNLKAPFLGFIGDELATGEVPQP